MGFGSPLEIHHISDIETLHHPRISKLLRRWVRDAGDLETAKSLELSYDEVTHVAAGHRWLCYICNNSVPKTAPVASFEKKWKHILWKAKTSFQCRSIVLFKLLEYTLKLQIGLKLVRPKLYEDL
ncbi:hypothetical protein KEM48_003786 [Puccinia striiformis f. sp. tritici PST-130]|nr:hypothetical protein KEM48_003786 [Puccinia striiformis f. sp. tritici PST-130]